jgi:hypothetical protein
MKPKPKTEAPRPVAFNDTVTTPNGPGTCDGFTRDGRVIVRHAVAALPQPLVAGELRTRLAGLSCQITYQRNEVKVQ